MRGLFAAHFYFEGNFFLVGGAHHMCEFRRLPPLAFLPRKERSKRISLGGAIGGIRALRRATQTAREINLCFQFRILLAFAGRAARDSSCSPDSFVFDAATSGSFCAEPRA
jgi:hypothetical protein